MSSQIIAILLAVSSLFISTACTTLAEVRPDFTNSPEERAYQSLVTHIESGRFAEAVAETGEFEKTYPYSLKLQKARYLKGQALEELGRYAEAAETYTAIANFSKKSQPEIAAQSLHRLSYVYEALGDNQRVLTSLFDAQRLEQYLPPEVSSAEIPARLSMAYMKEGNEDESKYWLSEAETGLKRVLDSHQGKVSNEWLARTYFNMGSSNATELTVENTKPVIEGQQVVQKYLLKSLHYNDSIWSARAAKQVRNTYDRLWKSIQAQPEAPGYEKFYSAGVFAELINDALLYQPAPGQIGNAYQVEVYSYLKELKRQVEELLRSPVYTPLIRKSDKASPSKPVPANILRSEDPN